MRPYPELAAPRNKQITRDVLVLLALAIALDGASDVHGVAVHDHRLGHLVDEGRQLLAALGKAVGDVVAAVDVGQQAVRVGRADQVEPAELLGRLGVRAVGHRQRLLNAAAGGSLHIEGLGEDLLDIGGDGSLFFFHALDAFDAFDALDGFDAFDRTDTFDALGRLVLDERVAAGRITIEDGRISAVDLEQYVRGTGLEHSLIELVKLRASYMNGCAFCVDMHTKDALAQGEDLQRILLLNAWEETELFTPEEKILLKVTEEITLISEKGLSDATYKKAVQLLGENYLAQVIMAIIAINAWNRVSVSTLKPIPA